MTLMLSLAFLIATHAVAQEPARASARVLKMGSLAPRGSSWDRLFQQVFNDVSRRTGGSLRSRMYFGGVAGDEPEIVAKVRSGELDGALLSTLGIQEIVPEMAVLEIPFLFDSLRQVDRLRPVLHRKFASRFEQEGFMLLDLIDQAGFIQVYSKERIASLSDMTRQKVWVWEGNLVHEESYRALGIDPVPLPVPEVIQALAEGRIDVITTAPLTCLALGWYQHVRYVLKLDYRYAPAVVLVSRNVFSGLNSEQKDILGAVFQKYEGEIIQTVRQDNETALAGMKKRGMEIVLPSAENLEEFKEKVKPAVDRLIKKGLFSRELYDEIEALKKEAS